MTCVGGGFDVVARNIDHANTLAGVTGAVVVASAAFALATRQYRFVPALLLAAFALHPAWTVAVGADCGSARAAAAEGLTAAFLVVLAVQVAVAGVRKVVPTRGT